MAEVLVTLQNVFTLAFIVSSMLAMGLSLTVAQIAGPLRNPRLVILVFLAGAGLIGMVVRFPLAAELGKRSGRPDPIAAL